MIDAVPMHGRSLIVGPTGTGKTRLTAAVLERWVDANGPDDMAVLDFAPEIEQEDRVIGGRLERFTTIPEDAWYRSLDARAPRTEGADTAEQVALANENAAAARRVIEELPAEARAVFVNDVTIPFQAPDADPAMLLERVDGADCVVLNAYDGEELGGGPILERERAVLARLRDWAGTVLELEAD